MKKFWNMYSKKEARLLAQEKWSDFFKNEKDQIALIHNFRKFLNKMSEKKRILATIPMTDEVDILSELKSQSCTVYVPRLIDKTQMEFRLFILNGTVCSTPESGFKAIIGASGAAAPLELPLLNHDMVIVPALGCDFKGYRLGRGGGYYDRWKERFQNVLKVALIPESLIRLQFQAESHDLQLNKIITQTRIVDYS